MLTWVLSNSCQVNVPVNLKTSTRIRGNPYPMLNLYYTTTSVKTHRKSQTIIRSDIIKLKTKLAINLDLVSNPTVGLATASRRHH